MKLLGFLHSVAPFVELNATAALVPFVDSDGFSYSGCQLHVFSCGDSAGVNWTSLSLN